MIALGPRLSRYRAAIAPKAIKRSSAALMMSIDIQIAIWLAGRSLGRARDRLDVVRPHPAGPGRSLAGSDRLDVVRLIRPAFPVERGRLDRLGRAPLLHDLELAAGPAVPSCVRRVLRPQAFGH